MRFVAHANHECCTAQNVLDAISNVQLSSSLSLSLSLSVVQRSQLRGSFPFTLAQWVCLPYKSCINCQQYYYYHHFSSPRWLAGWLASFSLPVSKLTSSRANSIMLACNQETHLSLQTEQVTASGTHSANCRGNR